MMSSVASLREAELAILNAPFRDHGWEQAVASIAHATRSSAAQLLGMGGPMLLPLNVVVGNFAGREAYFDDPDLHGECNWRIGSTTVPMAIQHEPDYAAYRLGRDTSCYDDGVSDLDIPFGCQSALMLDTNNLLGLALLRSRRDGPCGAQVLSDFAKLCRQLARSMRVQIALDGEAAQMMVGGTGTLSTATILLDRHGSVCAMTETAEGLFAESGPLRLDGLSVRLHCSSADGHLQQALARLLKSDGHRDVIVHQARVAGPGDPPRKDWRLVATRLPQRSHGLGFDPHLAVTLKRAA